VLSGSDGIGFLLQGIWQVFSTSTAGRIQTNPTKEAELEQSGRHMSSRPYLD
jgi:hypothetical protein